MDAAARQSTQDEAFASSDALIRSLTSVLAKHGVGGLALEGAERRATAASAVSGAEGTAAAFLGEAIAGSAIEQEPPPEDVAAIFREAARTLGHDDETALAAAAFMSAVHSNAAARAGRRSIELQLRLLVAFADAREASVWLPAGGDEVRCLALVGAAASSDGVRRCAAETLRGGERRADGLYGLPLLLSGRPEAALVFRAEPSGAERAVALAGESALALAPLVERELLLERAVVQERMAAEAGGRLFARLGFDLHDGPLQEIAALGADLRLLRAQAPRAPLEVFQGRIDDALGLLGAIEEDVRALARSMDSAGLVGRPFAELLREEADAAAVDGLTVSVALTGDIDGCTPSQKIALLRVVQEALSNARQHSGAEQAAVAVDAGTATLRAEIVDHGRGFDVERVRSERGAADRLGLVGMNERVRLLDGTLEIDSRPGGPTAVIATIPRWRPAAG